MSNAYNSFFMLHPNAPDDLVKALAFAVPNTKLYNCKIIDSGSSPYLHVEMKLSPGSENYGTLLIPHNLVLLAGTNFQDKTLGFVPSAS